MSSAKQEDIIQQFSCSTNYANVISCRDSILISFSYEENKQNERNEGMKEWNASGSRKDRGNEKRTMVDLYFQRNNFGKFLDALRQQTPHGWKQTDYENTHGDENLEIKRSPLFLSPSFTRIQNLLYSFKL